MEDTIAIIDKIIEEHKVIRAYANELENITNDSGSLMALAKSKDIFMPGRTDQAVTIKKFGELSNVIQEGLNAHFKREESSLLDALLEFGNQNMIIAFKKLLSEHKSFRTSLIELKSESDELINGQLSRAMWETKAYDMRAHITGMRENLELHAANEQKLLHDFRNQLINAKKGKK